MLKAIIVDDEELSRKNLAALLSDYCPRVEVMAAAKSVLEALEAIETHKPDIVFLDIQMQKETGFDVLNSVSEINFDVVFTTAHAEYAIDAIRFAAIDYLLKPIDIADLKLAVSRVEKKKSRFDLREQFAALMHNFRSTETEHFKLAIPSSDGMLFVGLGEVMYCEAQGNYTKIYTKDAKNYIVSKTLKEYENLLSQYQFARIHHSFLVNIKEIRKYVKGDGGYIIMNDNTSIAIAQRKKDTFLKMLDGMVLKPFAD